MLPEKVSTRPLAGCSAIVPKAVAFASPAVPVELRRGEVAVAAEAVARGLDEVAAGDVGQVGCPRARLGLAHHRLRGLELLPPPPQEARTTASASAASRTGRSRFGITDRGGAISRRRLLVGEDAFFVQGRQAF